MELPEANFGCFYIGMRSITFGYAKGFRVLRYLCTNCLSYIFTCTSRIIRQIPLWPHGSSAVRHAHIDVNTGNLRNCANRANIHGHCCTVGRKCIQRYWPVMLRPHRPKNSSMFAGPRFVSSQAIHSRIPIS